MGNFGHSWPQITHLHLFINLFLNKLVIPHKYKFILFFVILLSRCGVAFVPSYYYILFFIVLLQRFFFFFVRFKWQNIFDHKKIINHIIVVNIL